MSYLRAEEILPGEVLELVQQYIDGDSIYIPRKEKHRWGEGTDTKKTLACRNQAILNQFLDGVSVHALAEEYFLTEKSIQRIIRGMQFMNPES